MRPIIELGGAAIGGTIGFIFGGPIGAAIGVAAGGGVGYGVDEATKPLPGVQAMKFGKTTVAAVIPTKVTLAQSTMNPSHPSAAATQGSSGIVVVTATGSSAVSPQTVKDVQGALNTLGYQPVLKVDGIPGPMTTNNIKQYQAKAGMPVTGTVDPALASSLQIALQTVSAVNASVGSAGPVSSATQAPAGVNTSTEVQHALNLLGAKPALAEDGKIGPMSVAAIRVFQQTHGLTVDGIAGPKTKTALGIAMQALSTPSVPFQNPQSTAEGEANLSTLYS